MPDEGGRKTGTPARKKEHGGGVVMVKRTAGRGPTKQGKRKMQRDGRKIGDCRKGRDFVVRKK